MEFHPRQFWLPIAVAASLGLLPASASAGSASFSHFGGPLTGTAIAKETAGTGKVTGRIVVARTDSGDGLSRVKFAYAGGPCGMPPGPRTIRVAAGVLPDIAINMRFSVTTGTTRPLLRSMRSLRVYSGRRQVACSIATPLSSVARASAGRRASARQAQTTPTVTITELQPSGAEGVSGILVTRQKAGRISYTGSLAAREAGSGMATLKARAAFVFQDIHFLIQDAAGVTRCRCVVPDMDSDQSGMAVGKGSRTAASSVTTGARTLSVEGDGKLVAKGTVQRYSLGG